MPQTPPHGPRSRLSEADREQLLGLLREHYVQGQLDLDEMSRRVGVVLASAYSDEAMVAVTDLPLLGAPGSGGPSPAQACAAGPGSGNVTRSRPSQVPGGFLHRRGSVTHRHARSCGSGSTPRT